MRRGEEMDKKFTSSDIEDLLRNRFAPPAWAFLPQVRSATGFGNSRTADAIAMSLWPSRGLGITGFEIKIYRSDWLAELKNPAKAEEIAAYCDFWYIAAPKGIIAEGELPENWGHLEPFGQTMRVKKEAKRMTSIEPDRLFLAAILRKAQECITPSSKLGKEYMRGLKQGRGERDKANEYREECYNNLLKKVDIFEKASGVKIKDTWKNQKEIGEAVRIVLDGEDIRIKERLGQLLVKATDIKESITKILQRED